MRLTAISPCNPRVQVTMTWGCSAPLGQIAMYMRRVGEPGEFAAYPPIDIQGDVLTFQFDDLLFNKEQGRYRGRIVVGAKDFGVVDFDYLNQSAIVAVENVSV